ncbi:DUF1989 domain-containing protein [Rhodococcus rhodnii]|uniref:DUF1989 domain-containing protein n=2 Tax=Rhodococcus rhodnii TaxID=38312 RepID=R7WMS8_9NOCA|nr:urea amidolyase associated protein UAAP1 [Rhodococcus rhodnii]EOM76626.1 hypothetical protein Rrhod_2023 [Rhodococcus rhodnii LMG 5362]TXG89501.1 DUF1989 domain-containing protein [Rhodococcus rhodnii]
MSIDVPGIATASESATSTTEGARSHARAQEGTVVHTAPTVPASRAESLPDGVTGDDVLWSDRIPGGGYAHRVLAAGTCVRLTDLDGDACASLVLFNADAPWERLNVADTVKIQWQVYADEGYLLLSDQARVLATIVGDDSQRHDLIYGASSRARNEERYGDGQIQGPSPAGRELLAVAAAKNGLGRRDLPPTASLFQGVRIDGEGHPQWTGSAGAGASVTLRTELPVVMLVANAAHPLDPRDEYTCSPIEILGWRERTTTPDDPQWSATPEGRRAYENTVDYRMSRGIA